MLSRLTGKPNQLLLLLASTDGTVPGQPSDIRSCRHRQRREAEIGGVDIHHRYRSTYHTTAVVSWLNMHLTRASAAAAPDDDDDDDGDDDGDGDGDGDDDDDDVDDDADDDDEDLFLLLLPTCCC